jgi:short-subunit dehydrogenase
VPTALVTGASSGIGYELVKLLAADRHDLVLVARRGARLADLADEVRARHGVTVKILPKDLADPAAPGGLAGKLEADRIEIDVLVSSAGADVRGPFADSDLDTQLEMIQVNVVALTNLTRRLLPGMVARQRGRILTVASTAAFQPGPLASVYHASKAYVLSFSEALAKELQGTGVTVTALCPGEDGLMSAAEIAAAGYRALMQGESVEIPGFKNKVGARLHRVLPGRASVRPGPVRPLRAP